MTIDEAIRHQRDMAEEYKYQLALNKIGLPMYDLGDREISRIEKYVEEYTQVAEWLEELKALKEEKEYWDMQNHKAYNQGREDAIDEINNAIEELLKEPQYQHEGEDWQNGLIMAQEVLYDMSSELKEQINDN